MAKSIAPLDPNPFGSEYAKPLPGGVELLTSPTLPPPPTAGSWVRTFQSSGATVAFIPPGSLPGIFRVFRDDGVSEQPDWLSDAFESGQFKLVHGLHVSGISVWKGLLAPPAATLLARASRTRFRVPLSPSFEPEVTFAVPSSLAPPPPRPSRLLAVAGSHLRGKNGFLRKRIGEFSARLAGYRPDEIPQIGSSIQIWHADDDCKCLAISHNFFPKYGFFVDGVRLRPDIDPNFKQFDSYQISQSWRPFVAMQLFSLLRSLPLGQRYPGTCLAGWYERIQMDGTIRWCEDAPSPILFEYRGPAMEAEEESFWALLERYVRRFVVIASEFALEQRQGDEFLSLISEDTELDNLWGALAAQAAVRSINASA